MNKIEDLNKKLGWHLYDSFWIYKLVIITNNQAKTTINFSNKDIVPKTGILGKERYFINMSIVMSETK